jgi:hypothetical protein
MTRCPAGTVSGQLKHLMIGEGINRAGRSIKIQVSAVFALEHANQTATSILPFSRIEP